ncbi:hypothetical protein [Limnofasciculus baicalensis]|uniref:Uncharacterized protein n=1 Tax=Limnofasciculus baicalensis BBK-W-15 TaxID=2699891 RepID=A0AAE3GV56_9CYAN|nr:hypothetical protein [Limnofasciculus baicalensis]MCP2729157.1 hypothetical protein [Limnofasciculus baicalensis BBK-W-15]
MRRFASLTFFLFSFLGSARLITDRSISEMMARSQPFERKFPEDAIGMRGGDRKSL